MGLAHAVWCTPPLEAHGIASTTRAANQINALKAQELALIETLVQDFPERIDSLVLLGNTLYRHGQGEKALAVWHEVLKRNPRRADIHDTLGTFAMKRGQYDQALQHWRQALTINPNTPGVHGSMARALMALGRQSEAIKALEKDIEISPRSSQSHFLLGKLHLQEGRIDTARRHYEAAIHINPQHTNAYYGLYTVHTRLKDPGQAQPYLNTFKQLKVQEKQAQQASTSGFDDLTQVKEDLAQTCAQAYSLYQAQGQSTKALALLEQATAYDPKNTLYLATLATHYQDTGQLAQALAQFERISQLTPHDARAFLNMERLYIKLGRHEEAETALLKVIALLPQQAIGYRELAMLYLRIDKDTSRALVMAQKAVSLGPTATSYYVQGRVWERDGQANKARRAYERARQLDPDNALYGRAYERVQSQERP